MRLTRSDIGENLSMAFSTLRSHRLRSFLTVTGVVIGVATIMIIASIISGIDTVVRKEIESFGTNSIFLYKYQTGIRIGGLSAEERQRKDLTYEDAEALAQLPAVKLAVPFLNFSNNYEGQKILVSAEGKTSAAVRLEGTLPAYMDSGQEVLKEGRFFTSYENQTNRFVCVLRGGFAETAFPFSSPVGKTIKLDGRDCEVIGVLERREQIFGGGTGVNDLNNGIFVPFNTARKIKPEAKDVFILVVAYPNRLPEAKDQVVDLLRQRRHVGFNEPNNFGVSTADNIVEQFRSITFSIAVAMVVTSSIGLLVGGIGVMNIMLVSVTERTREIGVRKAMGARRRDIFWQFLTEAAMLTGTGGLLGLAVGWASTYIVAMSVPSYVPLWAPTAGFVVSVGIGLVAGLWPAWKAARLNPIDSLRYE